MEGYYTRQELAIQTPRYPLNGLYIRLGSCKGPLFLCQHRTISLLSRKILQRMWSVPCLEEKLHRYQTSVPILRLTFAKKSWQPLWSNQKIDTHSFSQSINIWRVLQVQIWNPCGSHAIGIRNIQSWHFDFFGRKLFVDLENDWQWRAKVLHIFFRISCGPPWWRGGAILELVDCV